MTNKRLGFLFGIYFGIIVVFATVVVAANLLLSAPNGAQAIAAEQEPAAAPVIEEASCDFDGWVGKSKADAEKLVEKTGRPARILPPGSAMTMDFRPNRINVELDDEDVVVRVFCG